MAEDTAYKVDESVAVFKKITSQNKVNLYYGDSTGFAKTINPELDRLGTIMMAGASFATELNDPKKFPMQFMAGPDYTEMIGILLRYIAKTKPGASVALVYSDTEFGRDPIATARKARDEARPQGGREDRDAAGQRRRLDRGDEAAPRRPGLHDLPRLRAGADPGIRARRRSSSACKSQVHGHLLDDGQLARCMQMGEAADGFMGVMPYRYYYDTDGASAPMLDKIRQMRPEYQSTAYMQGFLTAMLFDGSGEAHPRRRQAADGANMKAALNTIKDFDTGGIIGVPISIQGNSIPVGRIYQARHQAAEDGAGLRLDPGAGT